MEVLASLAQYRGVYYGVCSPDSLMYLQLRTLADGNTQEEQNNRILFSSKQLQDLTPFSSTCEMSLEFVLFFLSQTHCLIRL